jgi:hypothetical protein
MIEPRVRYIGLAHPESVPAAVDETTRATQGEPSEHEPAAEGPRPRRRGRCLGGVADL